MCTLNDVDTKNTTTVTTTTTTTNNNNNNNSVFLHLKHNYNMPKADIAQTRFIHKHIGLYIINRPI